MKLGWSDVTPRALYLNRRHFIAGAAAMVAQPAVALSGKASRYSTEGKPNTLEEITNYNNFIEFGMNKGAASRHSGALTTDPWSIEIDGLVERPGRYALEDLAPDNALQERIYRLRCVETWSLIIPWLGVPMADVLNKAGVAPGAKFVAFETVFRPDEMPLQRRALFDWPYREALRIDEAMHPLTILATGLYDQALPNPNGAPARLVVPWKYGFKSAKSVVRITLTKSQPQTLWNALQPDEYGFYANVNPGVDHPRWSQATERRVGAGLFAGREDTLMFNGYAEEVAGLYAGMDLAKHF